MFSAANDFFVANATVNKLIQESLRSNSMDLLMEAFSFLADVRFILFALPLVYWFSRRHNHISLILLISVAFAGFANTFLKELFLIPRPFVLTDFVVNVANPGIREYKSFSFPSGHSQLAATLYFLIFLYVKNNLARGLSLLAIFLVGFSRIYLGMHYPVDVLAGWSVGALSSYVAYRYFYLAPGRIASDRIKKHFISAIVICIGGTLFVAPTFDLFRSMGILMGSLAVTSFVVEKNLVAQLEVPKSFAKRSFAALLLVFGFLVTISLYLLAKYMREQLPITFICYSLLPAWIGIGFPYAWKFLLTKKEGSFS